MADESRDFEIVSTTHAPALQKMLAKPDAGANPFKIVIDPKVRMDLRRALIDLIDYHDEALAEHFAEGKLALDSYKEYIELFARSLKETMESREGVSYLLRSVGFDVRPDEINLNPELRWKKGKPGAFGSSLLEGNEARFQRWNSLSYESLGRCPRLRLTRAFGANTHSEPGKRLQYFADAASKSGERTRGACSLRRLAAMLRKMKSPRWRGRHRQHAPRVASQDEETTRHSRDEVSWK